MAVSNNNMKVILKGDLTIAKLFELWGALKWIVINDSFHCYELFDIWNNMTNYVIAVMRYNDVKMIVLVIFHLNIIFILMYAMYSHLMYQWRNRLKWMGVCIYTRVYDEKFLPKNSNSIVISRFLHRRLLWVTKSPENYKALPDIDPWTKEHQLITSRDSIKAEMVTPQPRHRSSRKHSCICTNRAHMGIPPQTRVPLSSAYYVWPLG